MGWGRVRKSCWRVMSKQSFQITVAAFIGFVVVGASNQLWNGQSEVEKTGVSLAIMYVGFMAASAVSVFCEAKRKAPGCYKTVCRSIQEALFSWSTHLFIFGSIGATYGLSRIPHGMKGGLFTESLVGILTAGILATIFYQAIEKKYKGCLLACPRQRRISDDPYHSGFTPFLDGDQARAGLPKSGASAYEPVGYS